MMANGSNERSGVALGLPSAVRCVRHIQGGQLVATRAEVALAGVSRDGMLPLHKRLTVEIVDRELTPEQLDAAARLEGYRWLRAICRADKLVSLWKAIGWGAFSGCAAVAIYTFAWQVIHWRLIAATFPVKSDEEFWALFGHASLALWCALVPGFGIYLIAQYAMRVRRDEA